MLGSNSVPTVTQQQKSQLRSPICKLSEQITPIKAEIARLEAKVVELEAIRDKYQGMILPASSTIGDLPPEILSQIFVHCISTDSFPRCNVSEAPLLLTTICHSWREISFNTARLWNSIRIVLPRLPKSRLYSKVRNAYEELFTTKSSAIEAWLDRSGRLPISFSVHYPIRDSLDHEISPLPKIEESMLATFVHLLFSYRSRWEKAVFDLHTFGPMDPDIPPLYCSSKAPNFSMLKSLELHPPLGFPHEWQTTLLRVPSVRELVLHGCYRPLDLAVRWENIVQLDVRSTRDDHYPLDLHTSIGHSVAIDLLSLCTSIESFSAMILCPDEGDDRPNPIELAHLHTLHLEIGAAEADGFFPELVDKILEPLTAPNLLNLSLAARGMKAHHSSVGGSFICDFINRSGCALSSLSLRLPLDDNELYRSLEVAHNLTSLELKELRTSILATSQLLSQLSPCNSLRKPPTLCPYLEHFSVTLLRWRPQVRSTVSTFVRTWKEDIDKAEQRVGRLRLFTINFEDVQPVRESIPNVFESHLWENLENWRPRWRYLDAAEIVYMD